MKACLAKANASRNFHICSNVLREICIYLRPLPSLVTVTENSLIYFNFLLRKFDPPILLYHSKSRK